MTGADSGSDTFDLSDSDARNAYTQDDSDSYDDPLGAAAGASAAPPAAGSGVSGIQPAGASASDTSSATHLGTAPEDPNSAYWSAFFGNLWDRATYVPKTVWATTGDTGYGLAGRVYVTAGTTVGSLVGVTQVSDAFARHDAVDAHEQTTGERVFKGVSGSVQLATLGAGAAGKVTAAVIPSKVGLHTPVSAAPPVTLVGKPNSNRSRGQSGCSVDKFKSIRAVSSAEVAENTEHRISESVELGSFLDRFEPHGVH